LKYGIPIYEKLPFPVGVVKPEVDHKSISVVLVRTEGGPWSVGRMKGTDGKLFSSNEIKSFSQVLLQF
jgi:hypothetical protein